MLKILKNCFSITSYGRCLITLLLVVGLLAISINIKSHAMPNMENAFMNVKFISKNNDNLRLSQFRGKVILLFFGYAHCPDICPTTLLDMAKTLDELGEDAEKVQTVFISVDHKRDTGESLAKYTSYFDSRILGITSSKKNIDEITKFFKVTYALLDHESENYIVEHSSNIYVINQNLIIKRIIPNGLPYSEITKAIKTQF